MKAFVWTTLSLLFLGVSSAYGSVESNEIESTKNVASLADIKITEERGRLIADLFKSYDNRNYPSNFTLKFGISIIKFDIDEYKNIVEVDLWQRQNWADHRLRWDPAEYGDQTIIRLPADLVWKPDATLYNSAAWGDQLECKETNVLVYSDGSIIWVPPCHLKAYCKFALDVAPYGEQQCTLKFGSWTLDGITMDFQFYENKPSADLSDMWDITDWEITGNKGVREEKYYDCCPEPYISLTYNLTFQRKSGSSSSPCGSK